MKKRVFAWIMTLCMIVSMMPITAIATDHVHDASCGYVAPAACGHSHDGECGYVAAVEGTACKHSCSDGTCAYQAAVEGVACNHVCDFDVCGYYPAIPGTPCDMGCSEIVDGEIQHVNCNYSEGEQEMPCQHSHDSSCGYTPATSGTPCNHEHNETCGYVAAVEGSACTHTCTDGGSCGYTAGSECTYVAPVEHTHSFSSGWVQSADAHWHECIAGDGRCTEQGDYAAHDWNSGYEIPSCNTCWYFAPHTHSGGTATCKYRPTCALCGFLYGETNPDNHQMRYGEDNGDGLTHTAKCSCGHVYNAAEGHTFTEWNEDGPGQEARFCEECLYTETRTVHTHSYSTATCTTPATCTCGATQGNVDKSNHVGGTEIRNAVAAGEFTEGYTGDTHCKGCGDKLSSGETIPATHTHSYSTATCTTPATCTCGATQGGVDKSNHVGGTEIRNAVAAGEFTEGYTGDTYCLGCGDKLSGGETIPATHTHSFSIWDYDDTLHWQKCECGEGSTAAQAHQFDDDADTSCKCGYTRVVHTHSYSAATCTTPATCSDPACGATQGGVDKSNHVGGTEIRNAVGAGEFTEGYTGDTHCKGCGDKLSSGETIPATHKCSFSSYAYDRNGHWQVCTCGATTAAEDHDWYIYKKDASQHYWRCDCGNNGWGNEHFDNNDTGKCDDCGYVMPHTHEWSDWTSNNDGTHSRTCSANDDTQTADCSDSDDANELCDTCGYNMHPHNYTVLYNDDVHWEGCSCGAKQNQAEHVYSNDTDLTCDTCGYTRSVEGSLSITGSMPDATVGEAYSASFSYSGEASGVIFWSATGLPDGLSMDAGTGVVSGTPTTAGTYNVTIAMGATGGGSASRSFTLTVENTPAHRHSYRVLYNETHHWEECRCDRTRNKEEHFDDDGDELCDSCGHDLHEHIYDVVKYNNTYHWTVCICGDFEIRYFHQYENDSDATCDCGYTRLLNHEHEWSEWVGATRSHYRTCLNDKCSGYEEQDHDWGFGSTFDNICDICGCEKAVHSCVFEGGNCATESTCACGAKGEKNPSVHTGETKLVNAYEAVGLTDGYTGDTRCSSCNALLEKGEVIPAPHQIVKPVDGDGMYEGNIEVALPIDSVTDDTKVVVGEYTVGDKDIDEFGASTGLTPVPELEYKELSIVEPALIEYDGKHYLQGTVLIINGEEYLFEGSNLVRLSDGNTFDITSQGLVRRKSVVNVSIKRAQYVIDGVVYDVVSYMTDNKGENKFYYIYLDGEPAGVCNFSTIIKGKNNTTLTFFAGKDPESVKGENKYPAFSFNPPADSTIGGVDFEAGKVYNATAIAATDISVINALFGSDAAEKAARAKVEELKKKMDEAWHAYNTAGYEISKEESAALHDDYTNARSAYMEALKELEKYQVKQEVAVPAEYVGNENVSYIAVHYGKLGAEIGEVAVSEDGKTLNITYAVSDFSPFVIYAITEREEVEIQKTVLEGITIDESTLTHVVQRGENLTDIARQYNCTVDEIVSLNADLIENPSLIFAGWELRVPVK